MTSTFEVDGKIVQNPSAQDIERGFASIDAEGARSMSIIQLQRAEKSLWAFGHPKEGYTLNVEENALADGTEITKVTSPANLIAHHEVITRFQAFRDGDESWMSKYQWETQTCTSTARAIKRILILVLIFAMLFLLLKFVLKLF